MKKKKEENFYVEIEGPTEIRRGLLESSKAMVGMLQKYEEIKHLREKKRHETEKFKMLAKEISMEILRVKEKFPQFNLSDLPTKPELFKPFPIKAPKASKKSGKKEVEIKPLPGTAKLEHELRDIERKLQELQ